MLSLLDRLLALPGNADTDGQLSFNVLAKQLTHIAMGEKRSHASRLGDSKLKMLQG